MRRFELHRDEDVSGVSGTGVVAQGVLSDNGIAVLFWLGGYPTANVHQRGMKSVKEIHCHGGLTRIVWIDESN